MSSSSPWSFNCSRICFFLFCSSSLSAVVLRYPPYGCLPYLGLIWQVACYTLDFTWACPAKKRITFTYFIILSGHALARMLTLLKHAQPQTQYILLTSPIQNQLIQHNPKEKNNRFFVLRSWRSFHVWQTLLTVEKLRHILRKIFQTNKITNVADLGQPGFLSLSSLAWKGFNAKRTFASCVFCKLRHVSTEDFFCLRTVAYHPSRAAVRSSTVAWWLFHVG